MTPLGTPSTKLCNGVYCLFSDNITCLSNWGFYLFDKDFDKEPELRGRIGILCLASLLDAIEGADRMLAKYEDEATALGLPHLHIFLGQADSFVRLIEETVASFTQAEQIFISSYRDQLVHSWLAKRHRALIGVKYFDGASLVKREMDESDYHALVRPYYQHPDGLVRTVQVLIERFIREPTNYWAAVSSVKAHLPELHEAIYGGREFIIPGFVLRSGGDDAPDQNGELTESATT
jgi:hypothetical protein